MECATALQRPSPLLRRSLAVSSRSSSVFPRRQNSTSESVRVPIIDKRKAQILSMHGNVAQLMDLATYETFELAIPADLQGDIQPGQETMYVEALGRRKLSTP